MNSCWGEEAWESWCIGSCGNVVLIISVTSCSIDSCSGCFSSTGVILGVPDNYTRFSTNAEGKLIPVHVHEVLREMMLLH